MRELGFQERRSWRRAGSRRGGDTSPDSVIFTLESNLSLFSSASASVDRCSFASDAHDHDSLASEISLHLAAQEHDGDFAHSESWSGPDPDLDLNNRQQQRRADADLDALHRKHHRNRFSGKGEKAKVQKEEDSDGGDTEDGNQLLEFDSARNSFSLALKGEKFDGFKDAGTNVSPAISRRDMATQMSPEGSSCSSPNLRPSFSASTPPSLPLSEFKSLPFSKMDVRDVPVDERVTMTRWSKKHRALFSGRGSENVDSWKIRETSSRSSSWDITEGSKAVTKAKREEAKINAWENLQKAKAEAAIRKLEMKLEKKRASSMDKIMNKLRLAQKKAQEMRSSVSTNQDHQVARTPHKAILFSRATQMGSLSGCFTCHAF